MKMVADSYEDRGMLTYNGTIDGIEVEDISDDLLKSVRHLHIGSYFLMKKLQPYWSCELYRHISGNNKLG
jgi:hypothetical protein